MRCLQLITAIFIFQTTTVFSDSTASEIFIDLPAATKEENPLCDPSEQLEVTTIVSDGLQEVQQTTPPSPFSFFFEKSMKAVDNGRQAIANVDWDALCQDTTKDFAQAVANINLNKMASNVKQAASTINIHKLASDVKQASSSIDIHKFASDVRTKVDDVQQAAAKIDLEKIGSDISQTARTTFINIKETTSKIDLEKLTTDLTTAAATAFNDIKRSIYAINLSDLPRDVQDWIVKHPYQTAFSVASGIVFLFPGIVTGPILHVLGFTPEGIRFGSWAAAYQSSIGNIPAGSAFAALESAGMGGFALASVYAVPRIGVALAQMIAAMEGGSGVQAIEGVGKVEQEAEREEKRERQWKAKL